MNEFEQKGQDNMNDMEDMNRNFDSYEHDDAQHEDGALVEQALLALTLPLRQPSSELDRRIFSALAQDTRVSGVSSPVSFECASAASPDVSSSHDGDSEPQSNRLVFTRWLAGGAAIAACAAVVTIVMINSQTATTIQPTNDNIVGDFDPVRIEHVYSDIEPEGVVYVDNDTPVQRFRRQTVEHVQLIDDKRNIRIEMTVPKEDVIIMPVSYD